MNDDLDEAAPQEAQINVTCNDGGKEFDFTKDLQECPFCHSPNFTVTATIKEKMQISEKAVKYEGKAPNRTGKKKVRVEWGVERKSSLLTKSGFATVERLINRESDKYFEKVTDEEGNVIHHCDEKLTDHFGHGSAKFKYKKKPE